MYKKPGGIPPADAHKLSDILPFFLTLTWLGEGLQPPKPSPGSALAYGYVYILTYSIFKYFVSLLRALVQGLLVVGDNGHDFLAPNKPFSFLCVCLLTLSITLFFYKNNFIRTRGSFFAQNLRTTQPQQKNKVSNFQLK